MKCFLSLDVSECRDWAMWHPRKCRMSWKGKKEVLSPWQCVWAAFLVISMWVHCKTTSSFSLSGDAVKDHPIKLKYIFFHHPDICYFVYVAHSANSTFAKTINLPLFRFTLKPLPQKTLSPTWVTFKMMSWTWVPCGRGRSTWGNKVCFISSCTDVVFVACSLLLDVLPVVYLHFLQLHRYFLGRHQLFLPGWIVLGSCSCLQALHQYKLWWVSTAGLNSEWFWLQDFLQNNCWR